MGQLKMINPNRDTSEEVLRRLKTASYERMRVELKNSIELKMRDFEMSWDDLGRLLGMGPSQGESAKLKLLQGPITLFELNALMHIFSCEPYLIFRPRDPWVKT
jgi:hypothetical protein